MITAWIAELGDKPTIQRQDSAKLCYPASMSQIEFMKHLQTIEADDDTNPTVTRLYKNSAGADVMIHLPERTWAFADWLIERGDIDFTVWVQHCEKTAHQDWPISKLLMYWLWLDECRRHRNDDPVPTSVPPQYYDAYGEPANER